MIWRSWMPISWSMPIKRKMSTIKPLKRSATVDSVVSFHFALPRKSSMNTLL